jgi:ribosomal 50S subunit-recycling heat shock protein
MGGDKVDVTKLTGSRWTKRRSAAASAARKAQALAKKMNGNDGTCASKDVHPPTMVVEETGKGTWLYRVADIHNDFHIFHPYDDHESCLIQMCT